MKWIWRFSVILDQVNEIHVSSSSPAQNHAIYQLAIMASDWSWSWHTPGTRRCENFEILGKDLPPKFQTLIEPANHRRAHRIVVPTARYNPALKGEGSLDQVPFCMASRCDASPSVFGLCDLIHRIQATRMCRDQTIQRRLLGRKPACALNCCRVGGIPGTLEASTCLSGLCRIMQAPIECKKSPSAKIALQSQVILCQVIT